MNINDIDTKDKTESPKVEIKQPGTISGEFDNTEDIANMLGIERSEIGRNSSKLNTLIDWAKLNTDSEEDIRWTIRRLESRLGTPPLGMSKLNQLAEYAFLWMQSQDINKKLNDYVSR